MDVCARAVFSILHTISKIIDKIVSLLLVCHL